ncbi:MAG: hypothetical protein M1274_07845 [Actinobacteria bacterium]|nr:hypothetical protein [Actinomycetota bacterium]
MELKQQLKDYALSTLDMSLVGVTGVDRLEGAPQGYRPTDILPGARSVIVMGVRLSWGAIQAIYRAHEEGRRDLICIYASQAYSITPNYQLLFAAYKMANLLERHGHVATALPSGPGAGGVPFSHRHAAVAAGLAEFGWNNLAVTPDYGPRVRWVSVITRAELNPDPLYSGPGLCDRSQCRVCRQACPVGAISATMSTHVQIGERTYEYARLNTVKCRISVEGLTTKSLGSEDLPLPDNPTWADVDKARDEYGWKPSLPRIFPVDHFYCGRCLAYCPIGNEEERRLSQGLSSAIDEGDYTGIGKAWRAKAAVEGLPPRRLMWDGTAMSSAEQENQQ